MTMKIQDLFSVDGKVVVVTGGGRGIGRMIVRGFVENGARVYICSRKVADLDATVDALSSLGFCRSVQVDLATSEGRAHLVESLGEAEGCVDTLVNNAGFGWVEPIDEFSEAGYDKVMDINLKAPFFLTREFLGLLKKNASATSPSTVINVGSTEGNVLTAQLNFNYGASKAGIHYLTRKFAYHFAPEIRVNAIAPGAFESRMQPTFATDEGKRESAAGVPLKRIGEPEDMAAAAIYLASHASNNVTGEVITVDAGFHLTTSSSR